MSQTNQKNDNVLMGVLITNDFSKPISFQPAGNSLAPFASIIVNIVLLLCILCVLSSSNISIGYLIKNAMCPQDVVSSS